MLRVAKIIGPTRAEGPFERCAIWVAGCDLACPGCCNPELFDPAGGTPMEPEAVLERAGNVEGITVLGGEPLQQPEALAALLAEAHGRGLGTIVFSGYTREQAFAEPDLDAVWAHLDTLVDGPFDARQPERTRRFIGSANQGLHHRTSRYADPALWRGSTRIEVRIAPDGGVEVHGMPRPVSRLRRAILRER